MNKLAILAFTLLLFFGAMLWYLADASLNQYIKSQITLQGEYYTGQKVNLTQANFSADSGIGSFSNLTLKNGEGTSFSANAFSIDNVTIVINNNQSTSSEIIIAKITINTLQIWQEYTDEKTTNLHLLQERVIHQLATEYPELYPTISAEIYAKSHPELNIALKNPQNISNTIIKSEEDTKKAIVKKLTKTSKRKRNKIQTKIRIQSFVINNLELNMKQENTIIQITKQNINLPSVILTNGIETNQLGGEILKNLLIYTLRLSKSENDR